MPFPTEPKEPETSPAEISAVEESVARRIISAHRARLNWLLRVPEWEHLFEDALADLGLPGRRQGVGLDAALLALPLEHKCEVIKWAISRFKNHLGSVTAQGICRTIGIERFNCLELDDVLTASQWSGLRSSLLLRLAQEHRRYKRAQVLMFTGYGHVIESMANRLVFRSGQRPDCLQEGALGLIAAIDRADESAQDFAAYAAAWIGRRMRNFLMREKLPVHAPVNLLSKASRMFTSGRDEAGAAEFACKAEGLLMEYLRCPTVSLDEVSSGQSPDVAGEVVDGQVDCPADAAQRADFGEIIGRTLLTLTEKQREVLVHRYGLGGNAVRTLSETARAIGISHQQVSMRERRALKQLERVLQPLWAELELGAAI